MAKDNAIKKFLNVFKRNKEDIETPRNGIKIFYNNSDQYVVGKEKYDISTIRQCIDRIATIGAKLTPKHIINTEYNEINSNINFLLKERPNPYSSTYDFLYKIFSNLFVNNNAFIFIDKDKRGVKGLYPISFGRVQLLRNRETGHLYVKARFEGAEFIFDYRDVIHLRLFYNENDYLGNTNEVLEKEIEIQEITKEGIVKSIIKSNNPSGILRHKTALKPEAMEEAKREFMAMYKEAMARGGIIVLDEYKDFVGLNYAPINFTADQLRQLNENIYNFFGINKKIIESSYNNTEWNAFIQSIIEPRAIQFEQEFTNKLFSVKEIKKRK